MLQFVPAGTLAALQKVLRLFHSSLTKLPRHGDSSNPLPEVPEVLPKFWRRFPYSPCNICRLHLIFPAGRAVNEDKSV